MDDNFIPVLGIFCVFGLPMIALILSRMMKHRERMEMLRMGMVPPPNGRGWNTGRFAGPSAGADPAADGVSAIRGSGFGPVHVAPRNRHRDGRLRAADRAVVHRLSQRRRALFAGDGPSRTVAARRFDPDVRGHRADHHRADVGRGVRFPHGAAAAARAARDPRRPRSVPTVRRSPASPDRATSSSPAPFHRRIASSIDARNARGAGRRSDPLLLLFQAVR